MSENTIPTPATPSLTREQFEALSPAEQRVAIFRDIIAQLDARTFTAKTGTYVEVPSLLDTVEESVITQPCTVCAIGAAFVSAVRLGDRLDEHAFGEYGVESADDLSGADSPMRDHLERFFTSDDLGLLESAFEMSEGFAVFNLAGVEAERFGKRFQRPDDRLRAICENGIANGGEFRPEAAPQPPF